MASSADITLSPPRAVTDAEVAFYREHGWVKLDGLLTPETAAALLARLKEKMGEAADRARGGGFGATMFHTYEHASDDDHLFRSISHSPELGAVGHRLSGGPVRLWVDSALVKMPASSDTGSDATPWHQDYPSHPQDRSGALTIWIALNDIPPERGSMRFLSGSRRAGVFGRTVIEGNDLLELRPNLLDDHEMSPPTHLRPGDATVHDSLTAHGAPPNTTDEPRWTFATSFFPADALYTGASHRVSDAAEGLEVNKPFDVPRFPIVG